MAFSKDGNFYGQEIEFLFEEYDPKLKAYKGHSSNYLECFVSSDTSLQGQVKKVIYTKENALHFWQCQKWKVLI